MGVYTYFLNLFWNKILSMLSNSETTHSNLDMIDRYIQKNHDPQFTVKIWFLFEKGYTN